ncbi:hypothetical protein [Streptomyces sp. NPDC059080]|uniref:hypothetical protein n=1 Tax=Streptomyces sp. NPDC059080 TaxID=3346718 RepID=UPI0036AEBDF8
MTGYLAEVRLEKRTSASGGGAAHAVGALWTVSPVLAVRWLRGQALRLAERVEPEPVRSPWAWLTRGAADGDVLDHAAKVRAWAWDAGEERAAREHIKRGHALFVTVPDADRTHTLSIWPGQPPGDAGQAPPEPFRHRIGGLGHPLHILAEDPWR